MADLKGTKLTWLGHSTVLITTATGMNVLIDPFMEHNPTYPKDYELPEKMDLILVTHGHFDHISDALPTAQKYNAPVVGMFELTAWLASKGVEKTIGMNLGGSYAHGELTITMTEAKHSSGITDGKQVVYGGEPAGFVIAIARGPVLYHSGDTSVFSDMKLIAELYHPEVGMLPIGGHYTMGPKEAALAVKYLGVKAVLPLHFGTMPELTGTPDELETQLGTVGVEVFKIKPGQAVS